MISVEKLRTLMKRQNITMYRLSKLSGMPESSINRLVWGNTPNPRVNSLKRIADALGVKMDELMDDG